MFTILVAGPSLSIVPLRKNRHVVRLLTLFAIATSITNSMFPETIPSGPFYGNIINILAGVAFSLAILYVFIDIK